MAFTRRTHIVRVPLDDPPVAQGQKPAQYADMEVLDAISFRVENGKEVILSMDTAKSVPYIVDNTDGNHGKQPGNATQRTHMERVKKDNKSLDVEVLDCWAARDQNGEIWILDMQDNSVFDISDGTGSGATRRAHDETVSVPFGKKKSDAGTDYLTVQRSDNIAFRKVRGEEVILSIPSCDDANAANVDFGRASTFITPDGYDPNDDSDKVKVPLLADLNDQHNYLCRVKGKELLTGDEKIAMGPFWWIRKVVSGVAYILFHLVSKGAPPTITIKNGDTPVPFIYDHLINAGHTDVTWYCWYPSTANVQVVLIEGGFGFRTWGCKSLIDALAGRSVQGYGAVVFGGGRSAPAFRPGSTGPAFFPQASTDDPTYVSGSRFFNPFFATAADAQAYADYQNNWAAAAGVTPQLAVGAFNLTFDYWERDVAIKCSVPATLTVAATLVPDPNDPSSIGGGIQAQVYSIDTKASAVPVPDPIIDLNKPPFLFNSSSPGKGTSLTYTVKVTRDTDTTDTLDPTDPKSPVRLLVDMQPPPLPA